MPLHRLNLTKELSFPALGLGTMGYGGRYKRDDSNDCDATRLIDCAIDLGIELYDTAEIYGEGHSEELLGRVIGDRRDKVVIASKFSPANSAYNSVITACEGSLRRLGTDYIDIYQTHWPNPTVPIEDTLRAFQDLAESGKIRAVGFCNTTVSEMKVARNLLSSEVPIVSMQQEYSLVERFVERACLPYCQENNLAMIAYSPLAQGRLAMNAGTVLAKVANECGLSSAQVALHWVTRHANVAAISMTTRLENLEANIAAFDISLPGNAMERLSAAFAIRLEDIPVENIHVVNSHNGKMYTRLEDAISNVLNLSPSPVEIAKEMSFGDMLKPVKVRRSGSIPGHFDLYEGQLRYWGWRIAHDGQKPIPAQITD